MVLPRLRKCFRYFNNITCVRIICSILAMIMILQINMAVFMGRIGYGMMTLVALLAVCGSAGAGNVHGIIPRPASVQFSSGSFLWENEGAVDRINVVFGPGVPESYTLKVCKDSVYVSAADSAGLYYAMQTLDNR